MLDSSFKTFLVSLAINRVSHFGMMNIGTRPTLNGNHQSIEVHVFDFNHDLYGKIITVSLLEKIRDEQLVLQWKHRSPQEFVQPMTTENALNK